MAENVPRGVATPGMCVSVPPCAAYRSPMFFTPGVSKTLLLSALAINQMPLHYLRHFARGRLTRRG